MTTCKWQAAGIGWKQSELQGSGGPLAWDLAKATIPVTPCPNQAETTDTPWCEDHRCTVAKCTLARVRDGLCDGHQPGSLRMQREARRAEVDA